MENSVHVNLALLSQFVAILLTGLCAGLLYGYDCSVIKGLGNLQDEEYLKSFQSINQAILNPYFFVSFMGSLLVLPLASWLSYTTQNASTFYLLLASTLVYVVAVFGVTAFGNVPLNEQLTNFSMLTATEDEMANMRKVFESSWNSYHKVRTLASVGSFALAILSLMQLKPKL